LKNSTKIALLVFVVLLFDQALKIWVKTSFQLDEEIFLFGWESARLHFVENPGMAFGFELKDFMDNVDAEMEEQAAWWGKLILSLFRISAVILLIFYIRYLSRQKVKWGLLLSFGLILAGALGNILDSAFYGVLFSESNYHGGVATFMPEGGGYANFLFGKVVDMFYFPMFKGVYPEWFPFWAGERYTFFSPIFNIADVAITLGVLNLLFFQRSFFTSTEEVVETSKPLSDEAKKVMDILEED